MQQSTPLNGHTLYAVAQHNEADHSGSGYCIERLIIQWSVLLHREADHSLESSPLHSMVSLSMQCPFHSNGKYLYSFVYSFLIGHLIKGHW